ncbi:hypothetical protein V8C37DRAFT_397304 [Trichoderma ceciliae]
MPIKKRHRSSTSQEQLKSYLRRTLVDRSTDYRLKQRVPIEVYVRCAELRYGKADGSSQTNRPLSPEVLDVAAFTFVMYRLSAGNLEDIENFGFPVTLLNEISPISLPGVWYNCYRVINNCDTRLGYLYFSEVGRYMYQHGNSQIRSVELQPPTNDQYPVARIALEGKLKTIFENYLFFGFQQSNKRKSEKFQKGTTDAVRMYFPLQEKLDFIFQVWVSSTVGKHFFDTRMGPVEHLEGMLGSQIFAAMELSCLRKEEKENQLLVDTKAIQVIPEGEDFKIEVYLEFEKGYDMYTELFPQ